MNRFPNISEKLNPNAFTVLALVQQSSVDKLLQWANSMYIHPLNYLTIHNAGIDFKRHNLTSTISVLKE